ncbi:FadR/GntR family transcriptional regulator [Nocardioides sp. GXZ039]|uniref:FadR/GntR family transcriptional regulator n=1 Tax=Nocardioides sp. GXZ039 TaxID=3136018 RepID=UPI0030F3E114
MFKPVGRSRAFERVVEQIEQAIYSGELKPGDHLPSERILVEQFEVGRSSVREALRILESMGLLITTPGSPLGPKVSASNQAGLLRMMSGFVQTQGISLGALVQYRMIAGSAANFLASQLRTDEHLEAMREANEAMRATEPGDEDRFARLDVQFHQAIADASGNPFLTLVNTVISDLIVDLMMSAYHQAETEQGLWSSFVEHHDALIEAIADRDGARASAIARQTLYDFYRDLLDAEEQRRLELLLIHSTPDTNA